MGRSLGWIASGITLVAVGLILGVVITASTNLAPVSIAQDEGISAATVTGSYASLAVGRSPFSAVADEVLPAVVSVDTKRTVRRSTDPFNDMFRDLFGDRGRGGDEREYREYEVLAVEKIQGFYTVMKARMKDLRSGGETQLEYSDLKYDIGLPEDIFTERYLRRAPTKYLK